VIGDEDSVEPEAPIEKPKVTTDGNKPERKDISTAVKKKAKKIKLSFDDPDGG